MPTHWLLLPHDKGVEKHQHIDHYIAELCEWLWDTFKEAQAQSTSEAKRQKQYFDRKANAISLKPHNLVLVKANAYTGKRKVKDQWEEEPYEVECKVAEGVPSYLMKHLQMECSQVLHWNWLFLITPTKVTSLFIVMQIEWARCATTTLEEQALKESEIEKVPQGVNCLRPAQHLTDEIPIG